MAIEHRTRKRTLWSVLIDVLGTTAAETITLPAVSGNWHWLYADRNGVSVAVSTAHFSSADDAEMWLDTNSGPLKSLGVAAVTLLDGEHVVYGPVRLSTGDSDR